MKKAAFTLIELSIVLVIIGLIVGGVLVGRDLIAAAEVRAQLSQIEKYTTATNTFRIKYAALPGDISAADAASLGLLARAGTMALGDNNGMVQGLTSGTVFSGTALQGELTMFWMDLSATNLIDGKFNYTSAGIPFQPITESSSPNINTFFPKAKLSRGGYVYLWSGGLNNAGWGPGAAYPGDGKHYFTIASIPAIYNGGNIPSAASISVMEAYALDSKIDDGFPQTGRVTAIYVTGSYTAGWVGTSNQAATLGSSSTCYDNANTLNAVQQYSTAQNNGNGVNCALSFRF